jgi:2-polyprenyl-3-methyl-5-hydroxy-6-metoxy-1,4-benzoquinol methylase
MKKTTKNVLNVYQKKSPSNIKINEDLYIRRNKIFRDHLKIPKIALYKKNVLDCGCGSGELTLYFAKNKCNITAFDAQEKSIEECKENFKSFKYSKYLKKISCSKIENFKTKKNMT